MTKIPLRFYVIKVALDKSCLKEHIKRHRVYIWQHDKSTCTCLSLHLVTCQYSGHAAQVCSYRPYATALTVFDVDVLLIRISCLPSVDVNAMMLGLLSVLCGTSTPHLWSSCPWLGSMLSLLLIGCLPWLCQREVTTVALYVIVAQTPLCIDDITMCS